jgi:uridine phosphorylase
MSVAELDTLEAADIPYLASRSWTTDAFYRETPSRTRRRVDEGCIVVEMEASAFIAVARFRGIRLAHLLYAGDTLSDEVWDNRDWTTVPMSAPDCSM